MLTCFIKNVNVNKDGVYTHMADIPIMWLSFTVYLGCGF